MDAPVSNFIHISSVPIADVSGFYCLAICK